MRRAAQRAGSRGLVLVLFMALAAPAALAAPPTGAFPPVDEAPPAPPASASPAPTPPPPAAAPPAATATAPRSAAPAAPPAPPLTGAPPTPTPPPPLPAGGARPAAAPRLAVVDAWVAGVDATAGAVLTERLRERARQRGLTVMDTEVTRRAHVSLGHAGPLGAPALLELSRRAGADLGVVAAIEAVPPGFRVTLLLAASDGTGPWSVTGVASLETLGTTLDALADQLLPEHRAAAVIGPPPPAPEEEFPRLAEPWRLVLGLETAFGVTDAGFRNHLLGARLERRFSETVSLGAGLAYANLKGPARRSHNLLLALRIEWRPPLSETFDLPIAYAAGFLPKNGPVMQTSLGLGWRLSPGTTLTFTPVAPTFWVTHDQVVYSFDAGLDVGWSW